MLTLFSSRMAKGLKGKVKLYDQDSDIRGLNTRGGGPLRWSVRSSFSYSDGLLNPRLAPVDSHADLISQVLGKLEIYKDLTPLESLFVLRGCLHLLIMREATVRQLAANSVDPTSLLSL